MRHCCPLCHGDEDKGLWALLGWGNRSFSSVRTKVSFIVTCDSALCVFEDDRKYFLGIGASHEFAIIHC